MQDLVKQEQFELEVLDRLNSGKFLESVVLGGGTMMRLCFGLNRFSVDLDFWIIKEIDIGKLFNELKEYLAKFYALSDSANKFNTLLFELKSKNYPRSLKIEIRKEIKNILTETAIAYSQYSSMQVFVKTVSQTEMMRQKINAFLGRGEIRDVFDIEFLFKRGVKLDAEPKILKELLKKIESLDRNDYTQKLGSLLEAKDRKYYVNENFKIIKSAIEEILKNKS